MILYWTDVVLSQLMCSVYISDAIMFLTSVSTNLIYKGGKGNANFTWATNQQLCSTCQVDGLFLPTLRQKAKSVTGAGLLPVRMLAAEFNNNAMMKTHLRNWKEQLNGLVQEGLERHFPVKFLFLQKRLKFFMCFSI